MPQYRGVTAKLLRFFYCVRGYLLSASYLRIARNEMRSENVEEASVPLCATVIIK